MEKKTQKQIVLEKLQREGEIFNVWCFQNGILRLGDIIHRLRKDGHNIETDDSRKNCRYKLISKETLF